VLTALAAADTVAFVFTPIAKAAELRASNAADPALNAELTAELIVATVEAAAFIELDADIDVEDVDDEFAAGVLEPELPDATAATTAKPTAEAKITPEEIAPTAPVVAVAAPTPADSDATAPEPAVAELSA
jgi:hypothetical protein